MEDLQNSLGRWVLPLATALVAWGGFPAAPDAFVQLTQYELVRWFLLFNIIWQGGGQQDIKTSLIATAIIYFVTKIMEVSRMIQMLQRPMPVPVIMPQQERPVVVSPTMEQFGYY